RVLEEPSVVHLVTEDHGAEESIDDHDPRSDTANSQSDSESQSHNSSSDEHQSANDESSSDGGLRRGNLERCMAEMLDKRL
ncbi:hypothetical protein OS493_039810, partial [Desmophyllum pertusum]